MDWSQLFSKLLIGAQKKRIPFTGTFELTPRCNLSCVMCYINRSANDIDTIKDEISASEWIHMGEQARDAGMLRLLLTGGEVFLRKDFREIYEELSGMGFLIQIFTNGTLITPEVAKWLGKTPPSHIGVTIYGASPETYAQVCGNGNAYHLAMCGVDNLVAEGIKPHFRMTVVKKNIHDFDRLLEYADNHHLIFGKGFLLCQRRDGSSDGPVKERLSPQGMIDFLNAITISDQDKAEDKDELSGEAIIRDQEGIEVHQSQKRSVFCGAGYDSFWLNWRGRMTFCGDIEKPYTLPFQVGFQQAWADLKQIVDSVPVCEDCEKCEFRKECVVCPGRLMNETGSFSKPAPYHCEFAQLTRKEKERRKSAQKGLLNKTTKQ